MRLIAILVLLFIASIANASAQDTGPDEKALRDMWSRFEIAFNSNDSKTIGEIYAADGDRINSNGVYSKGRETIEAGYRAIFERRKADPTSRPFHAEIEIRFVRPDVAILDGTWTGKRDGNTVRGTFTLLATKENGKWSIAAGRDRGVIPGPVEKKS